MQFCTHEQYSSYLLWKIICVTMSSNFRELSSNWNSRSSIRENNEVIPRGYSSGCPLKEWFNWYVQVLGFLQYSSMLLPTASCHFSPSQTLLPLFTFLCWTITLQKNNFPVRIPRWYVLQGPLYLNPGSPAVGIVFKDCRISRVSGLTGRGGLTWAGLEGWSPSGFNCSVCFLLCHLIHEQFWHMHMTPGVASLCLHCHNGPYHLKLWVKI